MKGTILLLAILGVSWTSAYPKGINFNDFPMRRMFVDGEGAEKNGVGSRIVGGREVEPNSIPHQTWQIHRTSPTSPSGWTCGGSLITASYVLTAAHCVVGCAFVQVYLGFHDVTQDEPNARIVTSTQMVRHRDYESSTISNDIGLISLSAAVTLNRFINVVPLPTRADLQNLYEGENVRVSGWGVTEGGGSRSDKLLAINSSVLSHAQCRSHFTIYRESELCISGDGGVGACNGDSGGPLVAGNKQVGIVSYGRTGCPRGSPSVFVRVTAFLDWIAANSDWVLSD